jgi:hypothetical protein
MLDQPGFDIGIRYLRGVRPRERSGTTAVGLPSTSIQSRQICEISLLQFSPIERDNAKLSVDVGLAGYLNSANPRSPDTHRSMRAWIRHVAVNRFGGHRGR